MLNKAISSWLDGYRKMFDYKGRATRSQFGFFLLIQFILFFVVALVSSKLFGGSSGLSTVIALLFMLVSLLTTLPYNVRRLRDAGQSVWYCLGYLGFAAFVIGGSLVPPTKPEGNKYA